MLEAENFKRVGFQLSENLRKNLSNESFNASIEAFLESLNNRFRPDELRLFRNGETFELWLRELRMSQFEDSLRSLANAANSISRVHGNIHQDLAEQIQKTVRSIGSYGINGNKRLYVGFNRERKVAGRKNKEGQRGRHYYANDHEFTRQEKPLPNEFTNRILQGDSEETLKQLPDNCIDLVFTSPPYNFGLDYETSNDTASWEAYFDKLFRIFDECIRVLKYGGRIVVNVQPLFSDYIPSHHIISGHLMRKKMIWKGEILWEKNNYNCKYTAWGSWKSPSSPYLKYTWEFLEIFCKGDLRKPGNPRNADITAESFKKWVVGKWSIAPERKMKEFDHPAMFPEELATRVLLLFSFKGDAILDPFAGVGTTCVSAKKHERQYLGIDISEEYCATATARLNKLLL